MPEPRLPDNKKFDPGDPNPCAGCSHCCEYIAVEIDRPSTIREFDQIIWHLIHKDVWVYIDEENDWYVQFNTVCEKLENRRCSYYPHRPQLCRDYEPVSCVRYGGEDAEKYLFKNEIDLFHYLARRRPKMFEKVKAKLDIPFTREQLLSKTKEGIRYETERYHGQIQHIEYLRGKKAHE